MTYSEALKNTFLAPFKINKVAFTGLDNKTVKEVVIEAFALCALVTLSLTAPISAIIVMKLNNK